ncbi:SET domain-containing protein [Acanthamoeba castellanii medusavirus]|uniref:SET domain-containing protein n=1 Tax=Acanthamoeba castellanii medusavirus J1 TaxID=3114988 RepID=A0A3T1CXI8_9VIRU|nr:SET domain-containing protein [Acanthamoeba castellanii medusavirus]BBI30546.1 SET domain-containing protein [Acanthamoeba castellanii medusavirus J1]
MEDTKAQRPRRKDDREGWAAYAEAHHVIAPSTIPEAGRGVFLTVDLPAGVDLGLYTGRLLTRKEMETTESLYVLERHNQHTRRLEWVDADCEEGNWLRFINQNSPGKRNNVRIMRNGRFKTKRAIAAGDELFVSYGNEYWQGLEARTGSNHRR